MSGDQGGGTSGYSSVGFGPPESRAPGHRPALLRPREPCVSAAVAPTALGALEHPASPWRRRVRVRGEAAWIIPRAVSAAYSALGAVGSAGGREMPRAGQSQQENADG